MQGEKGNAGKRRKQNNAVDPILLAKELESMPDIASSEHYQDLSLWTNISALNHGLFARLESVEEDARNGNADGDEGEGAVGADATAGGGKELAAGGAKSESFRDAFMAQLTQEYSDDLDRLRQVKHHQVHGGTNSIFCVPACIHADRMYAPMTRLHTNTKQEHSLVYWGQNREVG